MTNTTLLMFLFAGIGVEGETGCPSLKAIESHLAARDVSFDGEVRVERRGAELYIRVADANSTSVIERALPATADCEALEHAAATLIWAWTLHVPGTADGAPGDPPKPPRTGRRPAPPAGDSSPSRHAMYGEAFGMGVLYSLNYEYRPILGLAMRAGLTMFPLCLFDSCDLVVGFTPAVYALMFPGAHHLEAGVGGVITTLDDDDSTMLVPSVGYRYQAADGGFLFRVAFTPLMRLNKLSDILPWGGLSAGYSF